MLAGFEFDAPAAPCRGSWLDHGCLATVEFSGDARHRAITIGWTIDETARAWVDGAELPVPWMDGERPSANPYGAGWCGDRWYFVELADLHDHPGQAPGVPRLLSTMRGLLVWDAETARARIERPRDDERWTAPRLVLQGDSLYLLPAADVPVAGAARVIAAPW